MSDAEPNFDRTKDFELLKLSFDWCKHLSTLSTGSIVVLVTFFEKFSKNPEWKPALAISLVSFVVCILGSAGVQLQHLIEQSYRRTPSIFGVVCAVATILGFLVGVVSLMLFGFVNMR